MRESLPAIASEMIVLAHHNYLDVKLYFAFDAAGKIGANQMIKNASFYDIVKDELITCETRSNARTGTNQKLQKLLT